MVNIPQRLSGPSITEHEETGVVVLVVLYGVFQNFQAVEFGCIGVADGGVSMELHPCYFLRRTCRIFGLYHFQMGTERKEVTTLGQSHRV